MLGGDRLLPVPRGKQGHGLEEDKEWVHPIQSWLGRHQEAPSFQAQISLLGFSSPLNRDKPACSCKFRGCSFKYITQHPGTLLFLTLSTSGCGSKNEDFMKSRLQILLNLRFPLPQAKTKIAGAGVIKRTLPLISCSPNLFL